MAMNRIVLLISDNEITALDGVLETLDEVASMGELNDDYSTEVNHVNDLYRVVENLSNRIKKEVLAQ